MVDSVIAQGLLTLFGELVALWLVLGYLPAKPPKRDLVRYDHVDHEAAICRQRGLVHLAARPTWRLWLTPVLRPGWPPVSSPPRIFFYTSPRRPHWLWAHGRDLKCVVSPQAVERSAPGGRWYRQYLLGAMAYVGPTRSRYAGPGEVSREQPGARRRLTVTSPGGSR